MGAVIKVADIEDRRKSIDGSVDNACAWFSLEGIPEIQGPRKINEDEVYIYKGQSYGNKIDAIRVRNADVCNLCDGRINYIKGVSSSVNEILTTAIDTENMLKSDEEQIGKFINDVKKYLDSMNKSLIGDFLQVKRNTSRAFNKTPVNALNQMDNGCISLDSNISGAIGNANGLKSELTGLINKIFEIKDWAIKAIEDLDKAVKHVENVKKIYM